MATTPKGVPHPPVDGTSANDVPVDIEALASWVDAHPGVSPLTTAQRDALTGAALWNGRVIFNLTTAKLERYDEAGAVWRTSSLADHGELSGLGDDDHPQYLTNTRHDTAARHGSGVVDHGSIGGLTDDDHPQYLLRAEAVLPPTTAQTFNASGTFVVPDGVTRLRVTAVGGGGGGGGGGTYYNGRSGGQGGTGGTTALTGISAAGGIGGVGAGKNLTGQAGTAGNAAGNGGQGGNANSTVESSIGHNGNGGEVVTKYLAVTPSSSIGITVGAGGAGGSGNTYSTAGGAGGSGAVIVEW